MIKRGVRVDAPLDFLFAVIWDKKAPLSGLTGDGEFFIAIFIAIFGIFAMLKANS